MKTIILEIETGDRGFLVAQDLFGSAKEISLPGGAVLRLESLLERKAFDFPSLMTLALEVPAGIAVGVVSSWLYDKLKDRRVQAMRIDRTEITFDKGEIQKILIEKIESR
jgi:hypothetical protein